jgi:hypothetical protein
MAVAGTRDLHLLNFAYPGQDQNKPVVILVWAETIICVSGTESVKRQGTCRIGCGDEGDRGCDSDLGIAHAALLLRAP